MQHTPHSTEAVALVLKLLRGRTGSPFEKDEVPTSTAFLAALRLAERQGVAAALAGGLLKAKETHARWHALVPFLAKLEERNRAYNLIVKAHALALGEALAAAGIPCVVLKGGAFLLKDNDAAPWRTIGDLDLLVPPDRIASASEAIQAIGFQFSKDPSGYREELHHHYAPLYHHGDDVTVELHSRLMQNPRDDLVKSFDVFAGAVHVGTSANGTLIPCPEHRMIHLIAHAQISNWGYILRQVRLKDLLDAAILSTQYDIDWKVVERAFALIGARGEFNGFLCALRELLGSIARLPELVDQRGESWAREAQLALTRPPSRWMLTSRIVRHYVTSFIRNPVRLKIMWEVMRDPSRRDQLIKLNRGRIRPPI